MTVVEIVLGLFSVASFGIAVHAELRARSVEGTVEAMNHAIRKEEDLNRLSELVRVLEVCKDASRVWQKGAQTSLQMGRNYDADINLIQDAIDAIRTKSPLEIDAGLESSLKKTGNLLEKSHQKIIDPTDNKNYWREVMTNCQTLIRHLEVWERQNRKIIV